jgi:hypothetical protein
VLLVLAVLTGVLAMHGLAPGPVSQSAHPGGGGGDGVVMAQGGVHLEGEDCLHTTSGSGHVHHADATCAASGVGTPYAPPSPAAALDVLPAAVVLPVGAAASAASERAPPDLAELQLLRI